MTCPVPAEVAALQAKAGRAVTAFEAAWDAFATVGPLTMAESPAWGRARRKIGELRLALDDLARAQQ